MADSVAGHVDAPQELSEAELRKSCELVPKRSA